jgi:hydrogenase-1 operon protein HyaF
MFRAFLMQKLQDIAVTVTPPESPDKHANALPILHEILYALQHFAHQGVTKCIDLRAIPFGPGDEEALLHQLGCGEISLTLDSLGESAIWETGYSGVWVIDHRNATGERIALQIEIGKIPQIVLAQHEDILDAIEQLEKQLKNQ